MPGVARMCSILDIHALVVTFVVDRSQWLEPKTGPFELCRHIEVVRNEHASGYDRSSVSASTISYCRTSCEPPGQSGRTRRLPVSTLTRPESRFVMLR